MVAAHEPLHTGNTTVEQWLVLNVESHVHEGGFIPTWAAAQHFSENAAEILFNESLITNSFRAHNYDLYLEQIEIDDTEEVDFALKGAVLATTAVAAILLTRAAQLKTEVGDWGNTQAIERKVQPVVHRACEFACGLDPIEIMPYTDFAEAIKSLREPVQGGVARLQRVKLPVLGEAAIKAASIPVAHLEYLFSNVDSIPLIRPSNW